MPDKLPSSKNLIALVTGGLLLACSLTACLGFVAILIPAAIDSRPASVVFFSIFLIVAAVVLLLIGIGMFVYFGPQARAEWSANQKDNE